MAITIRSSGRDEQAVALIATSCTRLRHVMGLGHSTYGTDVMYASISSRTELTAEAMRRRPSPESSRVVAAGGTEDLVDVDHIRIARSR